MNPLENAVNEYIGKDLSRFHMPGHKGAENFPEYFKKQILKYVYIVGTGNPLMDCLFFIFPKSLCIYRSWFCSYHIPLQAR